MEQALKRQRIRVIVSFRAEKENGPRVEYERVAQLEEARNPWKGNRSVSGKAQRNWRAGWKRGP